MNQKKKTDPFLESLNKQQKRKYFLIKHWRKILFVGLFLASALYPARFLVSAFTFVILFNFACLIGKWVYKYDLAILTKFKATVVVSSPPMAEAAAQDLTSSGVQSAAKDDVDLTKALEALSKLYNKQITEKDLNEEEKGE